MKKLKRSFFNRPTLLVAEQLLGKVLVYKEHRGIITETEAYLGFDDPASHAFIGETPRSKIMFGKPGYAYIYLIYGRYHCLNIVTEREGFPAAVLIRAITLCEEPKISLDGPGKICRYLGLTKAQNGIDMITNPDLYVGCINKKINFLTTRRIGIKVGTDKHWRFVATP